MSERSRYIPTRRVFGVIFGCLIAGTGGALAGDQLSETLAGMTAPRAIAPPQGASATASFEEIAAPKTYSFVDKGDRELLIGCPCDVYWRSAGGQFSLAIEATANRKGRAASDSQNISSRSVADLMARVRQSSVRAASSGNGAGRVHIAEAAMRRLVIRADNEWSITVMSAF